MAEEINLLNLKEELETLLRKTVLRLNELASNGEIDASVLKGRELEPFIAIELRKDAVGTSFENRIEVIGGQKFPDIIVADHFGIEIKSTTQNHWTTTGNSVLETTRVDNVKFIWILFGKLSEPVEFKVRLYEECLSEVVVTHSPRYHINMDLPKGETIFDKIKMSYDKLRIHNPPLLPVLDYYRSQLKKGEEIWYLGSTSIIIKFWASLNEVEKERIRIKGFVFFPEIYSNSTDKFNKMSSWLIQKESIVCPNMRDMYSAGGKVTITLNGNSYTDLPRIIFNTLINLEEIIILIDNTEVKILKNIWGLSSIRSSNKFDKWVSVVERMIQTTGTVNFNLQTLISDYRIQYGI